jgi:hypothetical protein
MTQEDKELLLKDICARLPYGVKARVYNHWSDDVQDETITIENLHQLIKTFSIEDIKPYLFPLSSMTEEQKRELKDLISQQTKILIEQLKNDDCGIDCGKYHFHSLLELEWCIKNHFDYRGLIPKGLALDATGLGIYE